jgi:hypothetical protein
MAHPGEDTFATPQSPNDTVNSVVQSLGIEFSHVPLGSLFATKNIFYLVCFLKPWFLTHITATKNMFYLVCFLKPWFLTNITATNSIWFVF